MGQAENTFWRKILDPRSETAAAEETGGQWPAETQGGTWSGCVLSFLLICAAGPGPRSPCWLVAFP